MLRDCVALTYSSVFLGRLTPKLCGAKEVQRSLRPNERLVRRLFVKGGKELTALHLPFPFQLDSV